MTARLAPRDNPFRVDRLHALPFEPQGATWDELLHRLQRLRLRGVVRGPHGSGKTTLLEQLAPRLAAQGLRPRLLFRNRDGGGAIPPDWRGTLDSLAPGDVLLVDGYDHLSVLNRLRLRALARRCAAGLIATSHRPHLTLRTLHRTRTTPALLVRLADQLAPRPLPRPLLADLYARHRGNLRDAFRDLYDHAAAS